MNAEPVKREPAAALRPAGSGSSAAMNLVPATVASVVCFWAWNMVGTLTDRFGGRVMFTFVLLATVLPVLLVALGGTLNSFAVVLIAGLLLGVAGTVFAVGIPFVSAWYPPARRGFATGVFGAGMGGTALAAFLNPRLVASVGYLPTHRPTYLRDVYHFDPSSAGARTAGFALAAVIARPIGGVIADRIGSKPVVLISLAAVAVLGWLVNLTPNGDIPAGLTFLAMAAALGLGTGGVFAWLGVLSPAGKVGSISGIVSAAGGLGGYFPPLVMGATYNPDTHSYSIGLLLLVVTALVALVFTLVAVRGRSKASSRPRIPAPEG